MKLGMLGLLKADAVLDGFKEADKRAEQKSFVFMTFDVFVEKCAAPAFRIGKIGKPRFTASITPSE